MTASPDSLAPQFRNDPTVEPPYSNAQISETAILREIVHIYRTARRETRVIYDLGRDTDRIEEENWVIRWMLWHVFRYRDNRNRNRRATSPSEGGESTTGPISGSVCTGCKLWKMIFALHVYGLTGYVTAVGSGTAPPSRYWDPVRDA